jgi:DNA-binding transcriptional ArsR family regulator
MLLQVQTFTHLADLFSALSDPTRLRIISALLEREMNVGDIAAQLGMRIGGLASTARPASDAPCPQPQGWTSGLLRA